MSEIVKIITEKVLRKCPEADIKSDSNYQLIIEPKDSNGYGIYLQVDERENTLHLNSFHFHFENNQNGNDELINYFGYALSSYGRLKVYSKGGKEYKSTFEIFDENEEIWISAGTTVILKFAPWKKSRIKYYQNDWITLNDSAEKTSG